MHNYSILPNILGHLTKMKPKLLSIYNEHFLKAELLTIVKFKFLPSLCTYFKVVC